MAESGMTIINKQIKDNSFAGIYLMGGNETYLLYQYRDKLTEALIDRSDSMNYLVYKGENARIDAIADNALTMPFFADRRVIVVEDSGFFKKGNEEVEKLLGELPDTTVIIFVEENIDKRNKLYKYVASNGCVTMFDTPDDKTLLIWLKSLLKDENTDIEDAAVFRMLECIGTDMNTLVNEVEKLKCYCMDKKLITVADVDEICVSQIEGKIFEMMDSLSGRNKKKALDLYNDLLQLREPAMRILFLITRQFNILLKIKLALSEGMSTGQIASAVKVPPFAVKKYIAECDGYTYQELLSCVNRCQEADTNIKTGKHPDKLAVELLIVELLQNNR